MKLYDTLIYRCLTSGTSRNIKAELHQSLFLRVGELSRTRLSGLNAPSLVAQVACSAGRIRRSITVTVHLLAETPFVIVNSVIVTVAVGLRVSVVFFVTTVLVTIALCLVVAGDVPVFRGVRGGLSGVDLVYHRGLSNGEIVETFSGRGGRGGHVSSSARSLTGASVEMDVLSTLLDPIACVVAGTTVVLVV